MKSPTSETSPHDNQECSSPSRYVPIPLYRLLWLISHSVAETSHRSANRQRIKGETHNLLWVRLPTFYHRRNFSPLAAMSTIRLNAEITQEPARYSRNITRLSMDDYWVSDLQIFPNPTLPQISFNEIAKPPLGTRLDQRQHSEVWAPSIQARRKRVLEEDNDVSQFATFKAIANFQRMTSIFQSDPGRTEQRASRQIPGV